METETFRKVVIKSEADLPKEHEGWFAVHSKGANMNDTHNSCWLGYMYKQDWLRDYDWYLLPIEPNNDKVVIEKLEAINLIFKKYFNATLLSDEDWGELKALEQELAALKSESKEGEQKPVSAEEMDFGDYCLIEQKRYGCENEIYDHKVICRFKSNTWVDVPVQSPAKETIHSEMEDVISAICCGVSETEVLKYRIKDCKKKHQKSGKDSREEIVKDFVDFLSDEGYDVPVHRSVIEKYLAKK